MIANDISEVGWVVVAFAAIVLLGFLVGRNKLRSVNVKAGPVSADFEILNKALEEIRETTNQISDAVNHKAEDEPTLVQRVRNIEERQKWEAQALHWVRDALYRVSYNVGVYLPPFPEEESNESDPSSLR